MGGCHPALGLDYYEDLAARVRQAYPAASIKALTAVEVAHLAKISGVGIPEVLSPA